MTDQKETLAYIKQAIQLESSVVEQNLLIKRFTDLSNINKPQLSQKELYDLPSAGYQSGGATAMGVMFLILGLGLLVTAIWAIGFMFFPSIGVIALGVFTLYKESQYKKQHNDQYNSISEMNRHILEQNRNAKKEYDENLKNWEETKSSVLRYMNKPLSETKAALEKYYSLDKIYPKYRTLPALTSIYEYLDSGRCTELTGTHGAYNLYEDELRKNTIISQLNTIIDSLEQIKQNQYMLYQEMNQILINTQNIATEMKYISFTTTAILEMAELSAYYNGVTAANTSALAFYETMR